jgi:hypothetical protein
LYIFGWVNFCQRLRQNLENATIQDKRLALDALDIRIKASAQSIDIKGVIPVEIKSMPLSADVTTIAQTSASLFRCRYSYIEGKGYALFESKGRG